MFKINSTYEKVGTSAMQHVDSLSQLPSSLVYDTKHDFKFIQKELNKKLPNDGLLQQIKNLAYEPLKRDNTFVFGIEENLNPLKLSNSDPGSYLSLKPNIKRDNTTSKLELSVVPTT